MSVNQLKAGAVLSYAILGLSNVVGLLYTPYMLRMMGQSEYGLYSLVASVVAYLTILDLGFGNAIVRYTAKFRAEGKTDEQYSMFGMFIVLYSFIALIALAAGLVLYFNVEAIFGSTMSAEELGKARILMLLMVFNLAFTFPFSIFGSIITAYEDFIFQKSIQIVRIILNTLIMILLLKLGYRAIGMVVLITVFNVTSLLINFWYCKYKLRIKFYFREFKWGFLKEIAMYSFFIFLGAIIDRLYWSTGQLVLGAFVGTAAVAVFAVGIQLEQMYMAFSTAISGVFLPRITLSFLANNSSLSGQEPIMLMFISSLCCSSSLLPYP
jgi:O-antigen/teichoic acid export membrane protein